MKKLFYIVLVMILSLMFVPVHAATEDIAIESIKMVEHGGIAREVTPASAEGLNVNFNVKFYNKDDYVKYKVIIKNTSKDSYELSNQTNFNKSDYIEYKFEFENDNKVVDSGSEKVMYIIITYKNAVPEDLLLEDGGFQEDNAMKINLNNQSVENPDTGREFVIIMGVTITIIGLFMYLFGYSSSKKVMVFLLSLMVLLPMGVGAAKQISVSINSKVKIMGDIYSFKVKGTDTEGNEKETTYYFEKDMTLKQWLDSEYNDDKLVILDYGATNCTVGNYLYHYSYTPGVEDPEQNSLPAVELNLVDHTDKLEDSGNYSIQYDSCESEK